MKLTISILFSLVLGAGLNAQTLIGARGQVANTWMFNKNLSDNGDFVDYKGTYTGGGGLSVIQYLNETVGLELGLGVTSIAQRTQGEFATFGEDVDYVFETKVDYMEIAALFKALSPGGAYFEVGPMFMLKQDETESVVEVSDPDFGEIFASGDAVKDDFSSSLVFGVIGFGVNFDVATNVKMGVGLRLGYSFGDSLEQISEEEYNDLDGPELGWYSGIAHTDAPVDEGVYSPETTNATFAALNLGIYYSIGGGGE